MPPLLGPILETRELTMLIGGILRMTVRVLRTLRQAEGDGRPLSLLRPLSPRLAAKRAVRGGTWVRGYVRKRMWSRSRKLELSEIAIAAAAMLAACQRLLLTHHRQQLLGLLHALASNLSSMARRTDSHS